MLNPSLPPGRLSRKALRYSTEIDRLRRLGYSLEGIRLALAEAGVQVSRSTVQREVARAEATAERPRKPADVGTPVADRQADPQSLAHPSDELSARDEAEAFVRRHIHNPLLRNRS